MSALTETFAKSPLGLQALARRDSSLPTKMRSVLILVDGRRSVAQLNAMAATLGGAEDVLEQLLQLGLVEKVAARGAAADAAPVALSPGQLDGARRTAVRHLTDLLGPAAEDLCIRLERARSPQEFLVAVKRAELALRNVGGAQVATVFCRDMAGQLQA